MGERAGVTRLLCITIGMWIAFSVSMAFVATGNFEVVEPANLRNSGLVFEDIPEEGDQRRQALRYVASELNRHFFTHYDQVSLVMGAASLVLVLLSGRRRVLETAIVLVCCAIAASAFFYTTSMMVELGREIDFVPRDPMPPKVEEFYRYHRLVIGAELLKLGLLVLLALLLLRPGSSVQRR